MIRPSSFLEIDPKALQENMAFLRRIAGKNREILHVVKGNAYGHGIEQFVPLLQRLGASSFGVFDSYEAYRVSQVVYNKPRIVIMGMIDTHEIEWAISHEIEFYVFDIERLEKTIQLAKAIRKSAHIHIEVETGMNRIGIEMKYASKYIDIISRNMDHLKLMGLCTHFAGAEDISNYYRIENQKKQFVKWENLFKEAGLKFNQKHTACSAAAIRDPKTMMDMVRIGILQYGFWPSKETFIDYLKDRTRKTDPLQRVISWKSTVMSIKSVSQGQYVGYGTSYLASSDIKIASVPVGYAHGFARSLSNQGRVLINGERVPVIGTVNMNMILIDVSLLSNIQPGDEVVLIGNQQNQTITLASFSDFSNQLNYELLTRLPLDIPRVIKGNGV